MTLDIERYDTRYAWGTKPVVYVDFVPGNGSDPLPYPTLLDSGSPHSFLPPDFRRRLDLKPGPNLPFDLATARGPIRRPATYAGRVRIQEARINGLFFVDWPRAFLVKFRREAELWGYPDLEPHALLGTDAFKNLLVAFDHRATMAFLGRAADPTTMEVRTLIERFSALRSRPQLSV